MSHGKNVQSTQIHPWASSKSPKLSCEWSLTSEKLYDPKSEMEKASETFSSIKFCHRGAKPRSFSELCTPTKVPYLPNTQLQRNLVQPTNVTNRQDVAA